MFDVSKVIVVGDKGSGKTKLVECLKNIPFTSVYKPTERVNVTPVFMDKNNVLNIFDCGGAEKNLLFASEDWIDASVAIVTFDLSGKSWKNIFQWVQDVTTVLKNDIPIIIVGTKSDLPFTSVDKGMIARGLFKLRRNGKVVRYIETSAKKAQNFDNLSSLLLEYI